MVEAKDKTYTAFPEMHPCTSLTLFEAIYPSIQNPRAEAYFSSPITSGGAKRIM